MIRCFDIVCMVTDEATERFSPIFKENAERKSILKEYCDALDIVAKECDAESFEAMVDEIKMTITVRMESSDLVVQGNRVLYDLADRAISMRFAAGENDTVITELVFPSIWEKI